MKSEIEGKKKKKELTILALRFNTDQQTKPNTMERVERSCKGVTWSVNRQKIKIKIKNG